MIYNLFIDFCLTFILKMENKKISFGFSKSTKKQNIFQKADKPGKKIELIECLEAQTIKIKEQVFPILKLKFVNHL